jgi:pimeloyl-ACP methyl ester carboxylesterase
VIVIGLVAIVFVALLPAPAMAASQRATCAHVDAVEAEFLDVPPALVRRLATKSQCTLTRVPLDHTGRTAGSVDLFAHRVPAAQASRGAIVALAGGPGEGASPGLLSFAADLASVLGNRDLIILDQRGTGRSGALACPTLERQPIGPVGPAVTACAAAIGPRRAFYTTLDSADDIEVLRRDLGLERIALYGTSYGTKVALAYAHRYPDRVERLLLDSIVPLDGPDPFTRDVFVAVPRVLRSLCAKGACAGATTDPVGDLSALVKKLAATPVRGHVVGADGKRRARRLGRLRLLRILIDGDADPSLRAELPAGIRAALQGDPALLLRTARRAAGAEGIGGSVTSFSAGLYAATTCEEGPLPWVLIDPFSQRWGKAIGGAGAIPDASFFPFDRATGRASDTLRLCAHWPANGPARKPETGPLPNVPALLLSGEFDLRTPTEEAREVAALLPRATMLTVPRVGHSVLGSDISGCAARAVRRFFADQPVATTCLARDLQLVEVIERLLFRPAPVPPASLAALRPAAGVPGAAGRTLTAAKLTFEDALRQFIYSLNALFSDTFTGLGGLRGGRFSAAGDFDRYSYVPGVEITSVTSGRDASDFLSPRLRLRVSGSKAAHGLLVYDLRKGRIRGRLGGRRVNAPLDFAELLFGAREPVLRATQNCCRFVR